MSELLELVDEITTVGFVQWIGIAAERRGTIEAKDEVEVEIGNGIVGEHHASSGKGHRQVTLVQAEHLPVIAALCARDDVAPAQLRRNVVVSGINLSALKSGRRFRAGEVVLKGTGPCAPCSRLEETLGAGGYQAARGHGGITASVVEGGRLRVGDEVRALPKEQ